MTTIVNNPPAAATSSDNGGNPMGMILGFVALLVLALVFFAYVLPMLQNARNSSTPQINVPDKIDINVNQPQK